jgi:hypothetical protein
MTDVATFIKLCAVGMQPALTPPDEVKPVLSLTDEAKPEQVPLETHIRNLAVA